MSTGEKVLDLAVDCFHRWTDASDRLVQVRIVHMGAMTRAADYPVCAHCSELAGRLIAAPCPTFQAMEGSDAAGDVVLAGDRHRHFVLNGYTQQQWDDAARNLAVGEPK